MGIWLSVIVRKLKSVTSWPSLAIVENKSNSEFQNTDNQKYPDLDNSNRALGQFLNCLQAQLRYVIRQQDKENKKLNKNPCFLSIKKYA